MHVERHTVTLTTGANGEAAGYTPLVTGRIVNVIYAKDDLSPFADGVDFDIRLEVTGQPVWVEQEVNASKTVQPRQIFMDQPADYVFAACDRVKIAVSSGGASKTGTFTVVVA